MSLIDGAARPGGRPAGERPAHDGAASLAAEGTLTSPEPRPAPPDPRQLRSALRRFATGVTVVAAGRERPRGMTANSFTSVSLDPPLILICASRTARIHESVLASGAFTVSILAAHQEHIARHFADHARPRGDAEFAVAPWWPGPLTRAPILHGALAWLECALAAVYVGGDHSIFLGRVLATGCGASPDGLLFFGGGFHRHPSRPAEREHGNQPREGAERGGG